MSVKRRGGVACGTAYWSTYEDWARAISDFRELANIILETFAFETVAPELLRGESCNTTASDMYAFGILLYELFSRNHPYDGEDREKVLQQIMDPDIRKRPPFPRIMPSEIRNVMKECLAHEVEQRPTANEIDNRLQRLGNNTLMFGENSDTEEEANVSLFDIFPRHIAEALKDGRRIEPEFKSCVSIFFSDVVSFTDIASKLQPQKVARLLDRLYKVFDDLADKVRIMIAEPLCRSVKALHLTEK